MYWSITELNRKKIMRVIAIIVLLLAELALCGCKKETTNHLTPAEMKERTETWNAASPITNSRQILGAWKANAKDMPHGSHLIEWRREFQKGGTVIESIASKEWATGPVLFYSIKGSKLYTSVLPKGSTTDEAEIRLKDKTLLMKTQEGIYVFKFYKE